MFIPKPDQNSDFVMAPAGNHTATCYRFIDLGTQEGEYMGKPKSQRKVLVGWELCDEPMEDGSPFMIQKKYTWSMFEKAQLRKDLESWRGRPFEEKDFGTFDIKNVLGKSCLLNVVHETKNNKNYANIAAISALPKGMAGKPAVNPILYFSLEHFDAATYATLSKGLQETISKSPEYHEIIYGKPNGNGLPEQRGSDLDDDIPF